ncbi:MAG TPA: hypothetical protein VM511_12000 [Luteolibacter sp.]|nr:hypothetical protein [Luteolibacter sp.]
MAIRFQKLLAAAFIFTSVGCGPFFVKPGSQPQKDEPPPPPVKITASSRKEAVAKITEGLREKPEKRVFRVPGDHGWIEEYEVIKVEDLGVETVLVGKRKTPTNQITVRITSKITRWKFYGDKKKGDPAIRQDSTIRRYNF